MIPPVDIVIDLMEDHQVEYLLEEVELDNLEEAMAMVMVMVMVMVIAMGKKETKVVSPVIEDLWDPRSTGTPRPSGFARSPR